MAAVSKIHLICDNAKSHTSLEVIEYLWEGCDRASANNFSGIRALLPWIVP
jgi:hypothetical protein